jgi:hypothetical protein
VSILEEMAQSSLGEMVESILEEKAQSTPLATATDGPKWPLDHTRERVVHIHQSHPVLCQPASLKPHVISLDLHARGCVLESLKRPQLGAGPQWPRLRQALAPWLFLSDCRPGRSVCAVISATKAQVQRKRDGRKLTGRREDTFKSSSRHYQLVGHYSTYRHVEGGSKSMMLC